LRHAKDP